MKIFLYLQFKYLKVVNKFSIMFFQNILQVHDLMEDINEQQEVANEIANAISNPIGLGNDVDEDDLLKELETMEEVRFSCS